MSFFLWLKRKVKHLPKCEYSKCEFPQCKHCANDNDFFMTLQSINRAKRGKCPNFVRKRKKDCKKACSKGYDGVICHSCKHCRWCGEYAMHVCEKHCTADPIYVCGDYERKRGLK